MNRVELIGRLTKDPVLTTTNSGTTVAKFNIAVDRKFRNEAGEKITDFFNITAWKTLAENIALYQKKGSQVFIAGELQNRSWEAEDGTKRYITEIVASECEFLGSKQNNSEQKEQFVPVDLKPIDNDSLPF